MQRYRSKQRVGGAANAFIGIHHQHAPPNEGRPQLDAGRGRLGLGRGHRLAHLLDDLLDVAGIAEDRLQPLDHVWLMADVALHHVDGIVEDVVHRHGDGAVDGLDAGGRRVGFFRRQQLQRIERDGHVAGEDFQKLQIALVKRPRLRALHVQRAGHAIMQHDGHGQRAAGAGRALEIQRILARVFAKVTLAGGRHETSDAVARLLGIQFALCRFGHHADGQHGLERPRRGVEHANFDDVVMQNILRAVQDIGS